MKLIDIANNLPELADDQVICVRRPWAEHADCELVQLDETHGIPSTVVSRGFEYFLEVSVAHEVCEVFGQLPPSSEEIAALLLFYAENDAFPKWVYERQTSGDASNA